MENIKFIDALSRIMQMAMAVMQGARKIPEKALESIMFTVMGITSDLNRFLRSARILTVHRDFVSQGENPFWSVAVEYLSNGSQTAGSSDAAPRKTRVDYKAVLPPEDFAFFAQLREWRKAIAEKEGVPVYTIFTNDQLAAIVTKKITSLADLGGIDGVGDARLSKYGTEIVRLLQEAAGSLEEKTE